MACVRGNKCTGPIGPGDHPIERRRRAAAGRIGGDEHNGGDWVSSEPGDGFNCTSAFDEIMDSNPDSRRCKACCDANGHIGRQRNPTQQPKQAPYWKTNQQSGRNGNIGSAQPGDLGRWLLGQNHNEECAYAYERSRRQDCDAIVHAKS